VAKLAPTSSPPVFLGHGEAGQKVPITLVDETDLATLEWTIASPTIQISKNGAAWASASDGTWAQVGNGVYTVTLNATDSNALGWLVVRVVKAATTAEAQVFCNVGITPADMKTDVLRTRTLHRQGR
jgi:hypothetical protein